MLGISLIVITNSREQKLKRFFDSILNQKIDIPYEIILIDHSESQNTELVVSEYLELGLLILYFKFKVKGLSISRNIGLIKANYDIIAFPDDDCWYNENVFENVLYGFKNNLNLVFIIGKWIENEYIYCTQSHEIYYRDIIKFKSVPIASITIFFHRRFSQYYNFDINLGLGTSFSCGEDYDFVLQNSIFGKLMFDPNVIVHHDYSKMINRKFTEIYKREIGTGALYVKHRLALIYIIRGLISPFYHLIKNKNLKYIFAFCGRLNGIILWLCRCNS